MDPDTVLIDGHRVPVDEADRFFSGKNGERVTDEEWDESKRRVENAPPDDEPLWEPIS